MTPTRIRSARLGLTRAATGAASVLVLVALASASPSGLSAQTGNDPAARGVSPGSPVAAERLAGSCPTFSWSGVAAARGYELVLYQVTAGGSLDNTLQTRVAGDARAWTPSAAQCPASGSQYAWAVRALTEDGPGAWSEPLLFVTAGVPSEDELRQALDTLRRYREDREGVVGEGLAPSRAPDADASDRDAQRYLADEPTSPPTTKDQPPTTTLPGDDLEALSLPTLSAGPSPQTVTPPLSFSLNLAGDVELGGFVFKEGIPFIHNDGGAGRRNTAVGLYALVSATPGSPSLGSGSGNSAFGHDALRANTSGAGNTASGNLALFKNTTGSLNTASGYRALYENTTGYFNVASGYFALALNTTGFRNTASGVGALFANTTGIRNTASGNLALFNNTSGFYNTASGVRALYSNTTGARNTASGYAALSQGNGTYNTATGFNALRDNTGHNNAATGASALEDNTTGGYNTAMGSEALRGNTTGVFNTAIGFGAGKNWTTGGSNIAIGDGAYGVAGESFTIRIGGIQSRTFIDGIRGSATGIDDAVTVLIDSAGQLGTSSSSARVKEDIHDLADHSQRLRDLRPVVFRYRKPFADGNKPIQFGLIAEEVAEVFPELVVYNQRGEPETVKYHLLSTLLLNEVQRQEGELDRRGEEVAELRAQMADLSRRLERLARRRRSR